MDNHTLNNILHITYNLSIYIYKAVFKIINYYFYCMIIILILQYIVITFFDNNDKYNNYTHRNNKK